MTLSKSLPFSRAENSNSGLRNEGGQNNLSLVSTRPFHQPLPVLSLRENVFKGAFAGKSRERTGKESRHRGEEGLQDPSANMDGCLDWMRSGYEHVKDRRCPVLTSQFSISRTTPSTEEAATL